MNTQRKRKHQFISKKKKDDDSDDDDDEEENMVTVEDNHIYFYSDVTRKSVFELNNCFKVASQHILKNNYQHDADKNYIYLHIFSDGGCVFSAFAIIDIIKASKIPVVSIIEGCAASAATMISISCDKKLIRKSAFMLIHEVSGGHWGKIWEYKDDVEKFKILDEML